MTSDEFRAAVEAHSGVVGKFHDFANPAAGTLIEIMAPDRHHWRHTGTMYVTGTYYGADDESTVYAAVLAHVEEGLVAQAG